MTILKGFLKSSLFKNKVLVLLWDERKKEEKGQLDQNQAISTELESGNTR
jgi:hypothetical protein